MNLRISEGQWLRHQLICHNLLYEVYHDPILSDEEYDELNRRFFDEFVDKGRINAWPLHRDTGMMDSPCHMVDSWNKAGLAKIKEYANKSWPEYKASFDRLVYEYYLSLRRLINRIDEGRNENSQRIV